MIHWRRHLKGGGVQFFMQADDGTTCSGTVAPAADADHLRELFEQATGCDLPDPEIKFGWNQEAAA